MESFIGVKHLTVTLMVALMVSAASAGDEFCGSSGNSAISDVWQKDPDDCASFFVCLLGRTLKYTCPKGYVIGDEILDCVEIGSPSDNCTGIKNTGDVETLDDNVCKLGYREADEENCGKYLECVTGADGGNVMKRMECSYPDLFDPLTLKCDSHDKVTCEPGQIVPKNQCDYDAFQCTSSHCVPCSLRFPSCSGLPDGKHSWAGREWSPYYVVCEEERVIFQGECEGEKSAQVFHPEQRECVEIDEKTVIG